MDAIKHLLMSKKTSDPKTSFAYRRAGTVVAVAAATLLCPILVTEANAFKLFGITLWGKDEPDSAKVIDPVRYDVTIDTGDADAKLKTVLSDASLLETDKADPVSGDLGLVIKARDDRDRLIAALYENARYGAIVNVTVNGTDLDALPPVPVFDRSKPVPVVISVEPGPTFALGAVKLQGDAAGLDISEYDLEPGGPAGSLGILKAGDRIVNDLKKQARPFAKLTTREVVADHKTDRVDVTLGANGGPTANTGEVTVSGEKTVDAEFIARYSRLDQRRPYSPDDLKKAAERLRKLGVFSSVTIHEAEQLAQDGTLPLGIEVAEGKHRYFGLGAQYSSLDGAGLKGYWGHRNLFGEAESLRIEGTVSGIGEKSDATDFNYSTGIIFSKPGAFFPSATFNASLIAKTDNPDAYSANTITAAANLAYELSDTDTITGGGEISAAKIDDVYGDNKYLTFSLPIEYTRDLRDNKLNPTEGYLATLKAQPSYEALGGTIFTSFEGSISGYKAIGADDNVVFAARLSLGSLIGADDLAAVPATRRFYAGGGNSVRGYGYQEISPYNADGDALGGSSYGLASFEARVKVTQSIGLVPFLDIGSVSDSAVPDFSDLRMGAGVGVRYGTPFGPLRLDVAVPLNKYEDGSKYGIYAGIGQSF